MEPATARGSSTTTMCLYYDSCTGEACALLGRQTLVRMCMVLVSRAYACYLPSCVSLDAAVRFWRSSLCARSLVSCRGGGDGGCSHAPHQVSAWRGDRPTRHRQVGTAARSRNKRNTTVHTVRTSLRESGPLHAVRMRACTSLVAVDVPAVGVPLPAALAQAPEGEQAPASSPCTGGR